MGHSDQVISITKVLREYVKLRRQTLRRGAPVIIEGKVSGKTIINVDIQPEYENYITFNTHEWVEFINHSSKSNDIVFLYNGADTLGMIGESEYQMWLFELGVAEQVIDAATFYDKGYAFFRYCMDNSIDDDDIVSLIKFMIEYDVTDSRDIDSEMWDSYADSVGHDISDIRELLEDAGDLIHIPDLMDFLSNYSNIVLMGGGVDECLREVEIALMSLDKSYSTYSQFVY